MDLINTVFREYPDSFVIVFIDEILIYSKTKRVRKSMNIISDKPWWYLNNINCMKNSTCVNSGLDQCLSG